MEKPCYVIKMGNWNDMPKPFKEIELNDVLHDLLLYGWDDTETRQVNRSDIDGGERNPLEGIYNIRIFWFMNYGVGIMMRDFWKKEYQYFRIGCEHDNMKEITIGNCLHECICPECNLKYQYDSSD